jgi:hypothetical protein
LAPNNGAPQRYRRTAMQPSAAFAVPRGQTSRFAGPSPARRSGWVAASAGHTKPCLPPPTPPDGSGYSYVLRHQGGADDGNRTAIRKCLVGAPAANSNANCTCVFGSSGARIRYGACTAVVRWCSGYARGTPANSVGCGSPNPYPGNRGRCTSRTVFASCTAHAPQPYWQWLTVPRTHNPLVAGSSPARPTLNRLVEGLPGPNVVA